MNDIAAVVAQVPRAVLPPSTSATSRELDIFEERGETSSGRAVCERGDARGVLPCSSRVAIFDVDDVHPPHRPCCAACMRIAHFSRERL